MKVLLVAFTFLAQMSLAHALADESVTCRMSANSYLFEGRGLFQAAVFTPTSVTDSHGQSSAVQFKYVGGRGVVANFIMNGKNHAIHFDDGQEGTTGNEQATLVVDGVVTDHGICHYDEEPRDSCMDECGRSCLSAPVFCGSW